MSTLVHYTEIFYQFFGVKEEMSKKELMRQKTLILTSSYGAKLF